MKIGYANTPEFMRLIADETKDEPLRFSYPQLVWMGVTHFGVFGVLIAIEDAGEYIAHVIINYSELIAGRATVIQFSIKKEKRNPWLVRYLWHEVENKMREMNVRRVEVHAESSRRKWIEHIKEYGGFTEEATLKNYVKGGNDYVQLCKILGVT
jgi:hypothetical protein